MQIKFDLMVIFLLSWYNHPIIFNKKIMALLNDGINGGFTGKAGSIIGYQLNGKWIIKGLPKLSKKIRKAPFHKMSVVKNLR